MERITLIASGDYSRTLPETLLTALCEEIQKHMEAYGLTAVLVQRPPRPRE